MKIKICFRDNEYRNRHFKKQFIDEVNKLENPTQCVEDKDNYLISLCFSFLFCKIHKYSNTFLLGLNSIYVKVLIAHGTY